jgi:hypothetical protein
LGGRPTFYRADSRGSVTTSSVAPVTTETRQKVFQDLQRLSGFLSNWFDQHTPPKATADNYLEPGVHGVWLVKRQEDFLKYGMDQRQALARELPFGISLIELSAIFSRATSIQIDQQSSPLLWRLHDPWDDASYFPAEIELLNREVNLAESITSEPNAKKGLKKLRQICDLATQADSGIYFLAK